MLRELEMRTQHRDESLLEYVRAMQELYTLAAPKASHAAKVERVTRQAHPTCAAYLRSAPFRHLDDLAAEAKRIQGDILAARTYRPPPPASATLVPRCAWMGGDSQSPMPSWRTGTTAAYAVKRKSEPWDVSDRALDPYSYAVRAHTAQHGMPPQRSRWGDHAHEESDRDAHVASKRPRERGHLGISVAISPAHAPCATPLQSRRAPREKARAAGEH